MHSLRLPATLLAGAAALLFSSSLFAQMRAMGDPRNVTEPVYPAVCEFLTAQFSSSQRATPPATDDTARLKTALSDCAGTGESVVLEPSATSDAFYAGALTVNGEGLVVASGVTLFGSNYGTSQFISVKGDNASIMGPGIIDGRADLGISGTPRLINAKGSSSADMKNFVVYNVTLMNAGKMHLYIERATGVTVWGLTVLTPANTHNTDGVDIDSVINGTVAHSSINDGDDGIVIKTNSHAAANITVKNNLLYGTHGLSIGSQTMYGVTNVLWIHNTVFGTDKFGIVSSDNNGIRIKSNGSCGGEVKQVTFTNTQLIGVKHLMYFRTDYACSGVAGIPNFHDIVVNGFTAAHSADGAYSEFQGYDAANPLGLYLANVHVDDSNQQNNHDATVGLFNSNMVPAGPNVTTFLFNPPPPVH
jgi:polygalacturonase